MLAVKHTKRFIKDESGMVLVFVAICLIAIIGMVALTFDLGRLMATQTDLQSYADNVALAAAGELDGGTDAISRATAAAAALIRDRQTFADGEQNLGDASDYSLRFLDGLPADDTASVDPYVTTDSGEAVLVEVTATPRTVFLPFARALATMLGATDPNENVGAVAIAGYTQFACDITPLMFCMPSGFTDLNSPVGKTILLRSGGQASAWGPGDFGFLDPSGAMVDPNGPCASLTGVNQDACLIAAHGNLTRCFAQRGVELEPGQKVGIENSIFNTRFDMFNGIMSNEKNDPLYAPGPHVVKGLVPSGGGSCVGTNGVSSPDTMAFPPDDCFASNTCVEGGGRIGDGVWVDGRATYVSTNHDDGDPLTEDDPDPLADMRYEVYLAEITNAAGGDILVGREETGRPSCLNPSIDFIDDPDRRTFIAAGVDCDTNAINGSASGVPVAEFFKIFLLSPVGHSTSSPPSFDLWVEIVDTVGGQGAANDGGIFHDVVELYR